MVQEEVCGKHKEERGKEVGAKDGAWGLLQHGQGEEAPAKEIQKRADRS